MSTDVRRPTRISCVIHGLYSVGDTGGNPELGHFRLVGCSSQPSSPLQRRSSKLSLISAVLDAAAGTSGR